MRRYLLILAVLLCFACRIAWADPAGTAVPGKGLAGAATTVQNQDTSAKGKNAALKASDAAKSVEKKTPEQPNNSGVTSNCCGWVWFFAMIPSLMFIVFLVVMKKGLQKSNWSLRDALSESEPMKDQNGATIYDKNGNPVFARSSSRLLAFIGFFVIILWLVGFSVPTLYHYACTGNVPKLNEVSTFLLAQAGIFAPYIANKLAGAIKS